MVSVFYKEHYKKTPEGVHDNTNGKDNYQSKNSKRAATKRKVCEVFYRAIQIFSVATVTRLCHGVSYQVNVKASRMVLTGREFKNWFFTHDSQK